MSLCIATPCYGSQVWAQHMESCLALRESLLDEFIPHTWLFGLNDSLVTRARNTLVARFLQTDYEKLLFIDSDIEFGPDDVGKLWQGQAEGVSPITVGAYPMKRPGQPASAWQLGETEPVILEELDGWTEVAYAGTGFMMVDRSVFERLKDATRKHQEGIVGDCWDWFQAEVVQEDDAAVYLSEDYNFCRLAREAGYRIMLEPSIRLVHHGHYAYGAE